MPQFQGKSYFLHNFKFIMQFQFLIGFYNSLLKRLISGFYFAYLYSGGCLAKHQQFFKVLLCVCVCAHACLCVCVCTHLSKFLEVRGRCQMFWSWGDWQLGVTQCA